MWINIICLIAIGILFYKNRKKENKRKLFAMMMLMQCMGFGLTIWDLWDGEWGFQRERIRNEAGLGDYEEELKMKSPYYAGDYHLLVEEREPSRKEADELFQKAEKEIDATFLGENKEMEEISQQVVLKDAYCDALVSADWRFQDEYLIDNDGKLLRENIKEPVTTEAVVTLKCGAYESVYTFPLRLIPADASTKEGFFYALEQNLKQQNAEKKELVLPEKINGQTITWSKQRSYRGAQMSFLGLCVWFLIPLGEGYEEKKRKEKRKKELLADYPCIVEEMSLLFSVGIGLPEALRRIGYRYRQKKEQTGKKRLGYELLMGMERELADGMGERKALEGFGKNAGIKEYKKLSLLLLQNQQRGNEHLSDLLEKETIEAFEMRKNLAKKAGEEASTKLLFPLMVMLAMVLLMILMPAWFMLQQS